MKSAGPMLKLRVKLRKGISFTRKKTQFIIMKLAKKGANISVAR